MTTPSEVRRIALEALNDVLPAMVRQAVAEAMREPDDDGDQVWPDWYASLWAIPGFRVSLKRAEAWLESKGISKDVAENTAYALKGRWPGPKANPYKDPWATFQNWCKREQGRTPRLLSDEERRREYARYEPYAPDNSEPLADAEVWKKNAQGR